MTLNYSAALELRSSSRQSAVHGFDQQDPNGEVGIDAIEHMGNRLPSGLTGSAASSLPITMLRS